MPGTFPAGAPVLTGDSLAISRFLSSPTAVQRRLRDYKDLRFVSDQILTGRLRSSGGAVLYTQSEPFVTDRTVTAVSAGSEYPYANAPTGTAAVSAVQKWGQKVLLTDEEISRNVFGDQLIDRTLKKVVNTVISQVDSISISLVQSSAANTATLGIWTGGTPKVLNDILAAKSRIVARNLGYIPDTLVLSDAAYVAMMLDTVISNLWRRETTENPVYTGRVEMVAGLKVLVTPALTTTALVLDSVQLGAMADETDGSPGYSLADLAVQIKPIRKEGQDAWDLQGRRLTVPVVQETGAAEEITGVV